MRIRVVAMATGQRAPIMESAWPRRDSPSPWDELRERLMRRGSLDDVHVFLHVALKQLEDVFDYARWIDAVEQAKNSAWGARVVVVIGGLPVSAAVSAWPAELDEQLCLALDHGAMHVLQDDSGALAAHNVLYLHERRDHLQHVEHAYADNRSLHGWAVALPAASDNPLALNGPAHPVRKFLDARRGPHSGRDDDDGLIVAVSDPAADAQVAAFEQGRADPRGGPGRLKLVTLNVEPTDALIAKCAEHELSRPLRLGLIELRAFVLVLNRHVPFNRGLLPEHGALSEDAMPVAPRVRARFLSSRRSPTVLVTSAFRPHTRLSRESADDVGYVVRAIPRQVVFHIDPAVTPLRLAAAIQRCAAARALAGAPPGESDGPHVWIHGGHGSEDGELLSGRVAVDTEAWLDCFGEGQVRLALAIFLSCHSSEVARTFAEAGAGVAVGFDNNVWTLGCRQFAGRLLRKALEGRLNRDTILGAFRQAALEFRGTQGEHTAVQPRAFFAY